MLCSMVVCEITATQTRFGFVAKNQSSHRASKWVTPSWRIVYEKLICNEVTNNSSTVCHCYATAKRFHDETTAEVRIEKQVTSQKYVRYRQWRNWAGARRSSAPNFSTTTGARAPAIPGTTNVTGSINRITL